jgi:cytochrome P450
MAAYIPPYPFRPKRALPPLSLLRLARRNLLAIWPENTFIHANFSYRLFRKSVIILNSPEAVKQTFVDGAAIFEKKSSQQRNALRPLAGDGLIISDGQTWRNRRKVVAPVTHISRLPELTESISAGAAGHLAAWLAQPSGT